jgi:hypothetical protein
MVTGTQTQTVWAPWIRDLAEMLETCLAEVKHQGELKLQHPELLDWRLLHTTIQWKNKWALMLPAGLPGLWPAEQPGHCLLVVWVFALWTCQAFAPPGCHPTTRQTATRPPACQHSAHHLPQQGSNTTRHQLQTCLGDADKQDWMLKE